ncbi:MAG: acyl-CoA synthetase [Gammaproteobacteria bacterium]|nr:acyl-CoA synthetase [Gammaproteobacteria bacterium]
MSTHFAPLADWRWEIPEFFNIGAACTDRHLGTALADAPAIVVEDDASGTAQMSYAELAEASSRFAAALQALGLERGERVLLRLPNSLAYPIAFFGVMKMAGIAVPTSTLLAGPEVKYLAQDSGARVLLCHKSMWPELAAHVDSCPELQHVILSGEGELPRHERLAIHDLQALLDAHAPVSEAVITRAEDPAYLVYTSGTTGYPKGVLHAHRALLGRLPASQYWFDFRPGDRIMHSGKFNWTYVLGSALMDPLYQGMTVIVHEGRNDAHTWPRLIQKHGCTIFIGVPTIYRQIIQKTNYTKAELPSLRHCMSAGEHLSDEMFAAWKSRFGLDIFEAIGMSEFSYYISHSQARPIRPGSAGFPQPGHDVRLLDEDLHEVGVDEEGMIAIPEDDPGLFLRYWNLPEETAKQRHDGYFFTGDYARRDAEGYVWFLGRRDDILKPFGYRVSPHEIERVLKTQAGVGDCVCVGVEPEAGKLLIAAVLTLQAGAQLSAEDVLKFAEDNLAAYKRPKLVYFVDDYPKTLNGKVIRKTLQAQLQQRYLEEGAPHG